MYIINQKKFLYGGKVLVFSVGSVAASGGGGGGGNVYSITSTLHPDFSLISRINSDAIILENFDSTVASDLSLGNGSVPANWVIYTAGGGSAGVSALRSYSSPNSLGLRGNKPVVYYNKVTSNTLLVYNTYNAHPGDSPTSAWIRASNLNTASPTGYKLTLGEFAQPVLYKVTAGSAVSVASNLKVSFGPSIFIGVTIIDQDNGDGTTTISVQIQNLLTGFFLDSNNAPSVDPVICMSYTDNSPFVQGLVGFDKAGASTDENPIDDVYLIPLSSITPPSTTLSFDQSLPVSGIVNFTINQNDISRIASTSLQASNLTVGRNNLNPFTFPINTQTWQDDTYNVVGISKDHVGNISFASGNVSIFNDQNSPVRYNLTQHQPHIRVYLRAYSTAVQDSFANILTSGYVDMVDDNPNWYYNQELSDNQTTRLYYVNVTNMYDRLIQDYVDYCDKNSLDEELVFYHASGRQLLTGANGTSAWIAQNFINILAGPEGGPFTQTGTSVTFPSTTGANSAAYFGYFDKWKEINFTGFSTFGAGAYSGVWEYANARTPYTLSPYFSTSYITSISGWAPLPLNLDDTLNLRQTGVITFDPPSDWIRGTPSGSDGFTNMLAPGNLYYIRYRVTNSGGTRAVSSAVFGRNFTASSTKTSGTIPSFDFAADLDHDGYLNDTEYASRPNPSSVARFIWETRICTSYGTVRYATRLYSQQLQNWGGNYANRYLDSTLPTGAHGLMFDNVAGVIQAGNTPVLEPLSSTTGVDGPAIDTGYCNRGIMHNIVNKGYEHYLQNIAGNSFLNSTLKFAPYGYEEFGAKSTSNTTNDVIVRLNVLSGMYYNSVPPTIYMVDSQPDRINNGIEPRTLYGHLCYYYIYSNPYTYICWNGGYEPGSHWSRHWSPVAKVNIGVPTGDIVGNKNVFASGIDPSMDLQTALSGLPGIGYLNISGIMTTNNSTKTVYQFTFQGALANTEIPILVPNYTGVFPRLYSQTIQYLPGGNDLTANEMQWIIIGNAGGNNTYNVSFSGATTSYSFTQNNPTSSAASLKTALNALSSIGGVGGSVNVLGNSEGGVNSSQGYLVTFGGSLGGRDLGGQLVTVNATGSVNASVPNVAVAIINSGDATSNAIQTVTVNYNGQSKQCWGTYSLIYSGVQATSQIPITAIVDNTNRLVYTIFQRDYTNALVLFKPLSSNTIGINGDINGLSATTHNLSGTYYPVDYQGNIGSGVTTVSLRNGDGIILYKYSTEQRPIASTYKILPPNPRITSSGVTTNRFLVALPTGECLSNNVIFTPSDSGNGGSFTPSFVTLGKSRVSAGFRYLPATTGMRNIYVNNNGGLTNPSPILI